MDCLTSPHWDRLIMDTTTNVSQSTLHTCNYEACVWTNSIQCWRSWERSWSRDWLWLVLVLVMDLKCQWLGLGLKCQWLSLETSWHEDSGSRPANVVYIMKIKYFCELVILVLLESKIVMKKKIQIEDPD